MVIIIIIQTLLRAIVIIAIAVVKTCAIRAPSR
jgi:hypothetical protein